MSWVACCEMTYRPLLEERSLHSSTELSFQMNINLHTRWLCVYMTLSQAAGLPPVSASNNGKIWLEIEFCPLHLIVQANLTFWRIARNIQSTTAKRKPTFRLQEHPFWRLFYKCLLFSFTVPRTWRKKVEQYSYQIRFICLLRSPVSD
jgi:hypothetical protein